MSYITYKLKDLITVKHGYPFKSEYFKQSGPYIVMTPGNFLEKGGFKITPDKERYYQASFPIEYLLHKGDLVVAMTEQTRGLLGSSVIIPQDGFLLHNQRIGLVRCDEAKINKNYLYYLFNTSYVREQIESSASGTKIKHTSPEKIGEVVVHIPESTTEQEHIASTLLSIDRKIGLNNCICAELEAMAKTLYDYWFVQFDFPDENGKPYRTNGGAMEWCQELGREVPKGWKTTTIGEITICHDSERVPLSDNQRQEIPGEIPYYGATGMMGSVNRAIFDGDYVLMAEDGSVMDQQGHPVLQRIHHPCWINNHAHVLEPKADYSCMLLYMLLKDIPVVKIKTGSIQMKINQANMNAYHIIDIPAQLRLKANEFLSHVDKQIDEIKNENQELSKLRDWLLPMLMNGQARIMAVRR